ALAGPDRRPVAEGDLAVIAAARDPGGAGVLLRPVHPVWELVVRDDVVELRRGLVVPAAPRRAAVQTDRRTLVAAHDHARGCVRIDPELVIVVAARSALDRRKRLAAVGGAEQRHVRHVDDVGVPGIDGDAAEIPVPARDPGVAAGEPPAITGVVGAVHSRALLGPHPRALPTA